ncbi:hypothetical protein QAD02_002155 [Eretmocerus hayati]|uniref:Uncharacterized protein n=1 Tax=Eretmocerus hayati TaxID=131215 RepID=A0ACC2NIH1_9HYME|nr:hypothetical protein QAD02_002155 [Eretmocerus hayati]
MYKTEYFEKSFKERSGRLCKVAIRRSEFLNSVSELNNPYPVNVLGRGNVESIRDPRIRKRLGLLEIVTHIPTPPPSPERIHPYCERKRRPTPPREYKRARTSEGTTEIQSSVPALNFDQVVSEYKATAPTTREDLRVDAGVTFPPLVKLVEYSTACVKCEKCVKADNDVIRVDYLQLRFPSLLL